MDIADEAYREWRQPEQNAADTLGVAAAIARRLTEVVAAKAELENEERFLRERLRAMLPTGTTHAGDNIIMIRPNRRFDQTLAASVLTPYELQTVQAITISSTRAREMLSPERYAACQAITGAPIVTVKLADKPQE